MSPPAVRCSQERSILNAILIHANAFLNPSATICIPAETYLKKLLQDTAVSLVTALVFMPNASSTEFHTSSTDENTATTKSRNAVNVCASPVKMLFDMSMMIPLFSSIHPIASARPSRRVSKSEPTRTVQSLEMPTISRASAPRLSLTVENRPDIVLDWFAIIPANFQPSDVRFIRACCTCGNPTFHSDTISFTAPWETPRTRDSSAMSGTPALVNCIRSPPISFPDT